MELSKKLILNKVEKHVGLLKEVLESPDLFLVVIAKIHENN